MKILKFCFLLIIFNCCKSNTNNDDFKLNKIINCPNKELLISSEKNNWLIDFDSIKSINEFICLKSEKIKDSKNKLNQKIYDSIELKYGKEKIPFEYKQPQVFPFIKIDGIDVSLLQVKYSSAIVQFPYVKTIRIWDNFNKQNDEIRNAIIYLLEKDNFARNNNSYRVLTIQIGSDEFDNLKKIIPQIISIYFEYLESKANKQLCESTREEIIKLKNDYQLKINITSNDFPHKSMSQFLKENCK